MDDEYRLHERESSWLYRRSAPEPGEWHDWPPRQQGQQGQQGLSKGSRASRDSRDSRTAARMAPAYGAGPRRSAQYECLGDHVFQQELFYLQRESNHLKRFQLLI